MANTKDMKPKLSISVNKNPTKEGVKVQFTLPQTLEGDAKAEVTQKLQNKLNQGLSQYNLTISQDTDVPYSNVIGFLIPIADIKLLIKKAISTPTAEEPIGESKVRTTNADVYLKEQMPHIYNSSDIYLSDVIQAMEGYTENNQTL